MKNIHIWVITYNHENFIGECLEGIISQNTTNFAIKIYIGVDLCSDKTPEIVNTYKKRYPNIIEVMITTNRLGYHENFIRTLEQAQRGADYIAMCEGDDCWTDKNKLAIQFDFLENNKKYVMVCHDGVNLIEDKIKSESFSKSRIKQYDQKRELTDVEIISSPNRAIHLSSLLYRSSKLDCQVLRNHFYQAPVLDTPLINITCAKGKVLYLPQKMFYQRDLESSITNKRRFSKAYFEEVKKMLYNINNCLDKNYSKEIKTAVRGRYFAYLRSEYLTSNSFLCKLKLIIKMIFLKKPHNFNFKDLQYFIRKNTF